MKQASNTAKIMLRSLTVTAFLLLCAFSAIAAMGYAYSVMEKNIYGHTVAAISVTELDRITVFGREISFPLMSVGLKAAELYEKYAFGTLKLLGFVLNGVEELCRSVLVDLFG